MEARVRLNGTGRDTCDQFSAKRKEPTSQLPSSGETKSNSGTENLSEKQQEKSEDADPRGSDTGRSNREA